MTLDPVSSVNQLLTHMLWSRERGALADTECEFAAQVSLKAGGLKPTSCVVIAKSVEYGFALKEQENGYIYTVTENGDPLLCCDLAAKHNDWLFLFIRHRAAEAMLACAK